MQFHGGMSDEQREEVQRAFNSPPQSHPVRILIATDAARERVNLQGHCADLFHFDIPWNPAKMEQRNGRIDRTLQPAAEVRCHYFVYPQRREDLVLRHLVRKVDTIRHELGSLSTVIMGRLADVMAGGIVTDTKDQLDTAATAGGRSDTARAELEAGRDDLKALRREIDEAGRILDRSRTAIDFDPSALKATVDVGLELTGAAPLQPDNDSGGGNSAVCTLPELPESWQETLDSLRPPRARYMVATNQGLTQTYNRLKDPACDEPEIVELRRLHEEMDRAVLAAYGWDDIPVPAYGTPVSDAERRAIERFEDEVIDRLFLLNQQRAREEQILGLTANRKTARQPRQAKLLDEVGGPEEMGLFDGE